MKNLLIILIALFSINIQSQNIPSISYHTVGKTYETNSLVSVDGTIYKALSATNITPPDASWTLVADEELVEEVVNPLDPYFGTKIQPSKANSGFYTTSSVNGATGYLANLTSSGNGAYTGLHLVNNSNEFVDETTFLHYGSGYFVTKYRNNGSAYFTNDFYFTGAKNSSNMIFELGTSTIADNSAQEDILRLNSDRTVTFPALTSALINLGGDQSPITLKHFNENTSLEQVLTRGNTSTIDAIVNGVIVGKGSGNDASNTTLGNNALIANSGTNNTAVGNGTLDNNTTGSNNIGVGYQAITINFTGNNNVAIGNSSIGSSGSDNNTAVGNEALGSSVGSGNTALGYQAGRFRSSGGDNFTNTDGVYIGRDTRSSQQGNSNEIVIGATAIGNGPNSATLGNDSIIGTYLKGILHLNNLNTAPASAVDTGVTGEIRITSGHIYVCIATNTWVRTELTTW